LIPLIFCQGSAAVAEQNLAPALVYGKRMQLCHLRLYKTGKEKIPEREKRLTSFLSYQFKAELRRPQAALCPGISIVEIDQNGA
jgi:hypothetical protein